jgi:hypothetical protein
MLRVIDVVVACVKKLVVRATIPKSRIFYLAKMLFLLPAKMKEGKEEGKRRAAS